MRQENRIIAVRNSEIQVKTKDDAGSLNFENSLFVKTEQSTKLVPKLVSPKKKALIANDLVIDAEFQKLRGGNDFPSVDEFLLSHSELLQNKQHTKGAITNDETTLNIARDILNFDQSKSDNLSYILEQPNYSTNELGSVKVVISALENFPQFQKIYNQHKDKEVMLCVGGPAASDQALIASMIPEISDKLDKIIYATRDYRESNVAHSAKQYHIRHANALNADPSLTGRNIIKTVLRRLFFGMNSKEIIKSNFLKIDVNLNLNPKVLKIYLGNEINAIKQNIRELKGQLTEHDINRISAFIGGEFFTIIEERMSVKLSGKSENANLNHPSAIHVTFNEEEAHHAEVENKLLERINISNQELSREQIDNFFGKKNKIYKAYGYKSDTYAVFDIHGKSREYAVKRGVEWQDNVEIKKILLTKDFDGEPKIAGVIDDDGNFTYVSKLHFSGGYKVDYIYDAPANSASALRKIISKIENILALQKPLKNEITIATGVSINAIFKKKEKLGEISVTNSHWTKVAENDEHMIVRMTGGGNAGSEKYNPAYAVNVVANSRRIFGDDLVGIISTYGCSRAVNSKNSTEWAKIAKGFVVSYGKGGTGNTKRHFEALKALHKLGFAGELNNFCNDYESQRGGKLGDQLNEIMVASNRDFFYDNSIRTKRRLGFVNKVSLAEIFHLLLAIPRMIFLTK
jgi:hypothetical protein